MEVGWRTCAGRVRVDLWRLRVDGWVTVALVQMFCAVFFICAFGAALLPRSDPGTGLLRIARPHLECQSECVCARPCGGERAAVQRAAAWGAFSARSPTGAPWSRSNALPPRPRLLRSDGGPAGHRPGASGACSQMWQLHGVRERRARDSDQLQHVHAGRLPAERPQLLRGKQRCEASPMLPTRGGDGMAAPFPRQPPLCRQFPRSR